MKNSRNLKVIFLLAGLLFFQSNSVFTRQSYTGLRSDEELLGNSVWDQQDKNLPGPPIITWISPSKQYINLKTTKVSISATVKTSSNISSVSLYLNDVLYGAPDMAISTTEKATFIASKTINLEPGENSIYFVATNSEGSTTSEKRFLTVPIISRTADLPLIVWAIPNEKNITLKTSSSNIQVTIRSASDLKSVVLYLNDVSQGETETKPSQNETGSYVVEKTVSFSQVSNNIYLEATNSEGSTTSEKRFFTIPISSLINEPTIESLPTAPIITWVSPSGANSKLKSPEASITATVKTSSNISSVSLYLNDVLYGAPDMAISTTEKATFIASKTIILEPGENSIYFVATNSEGSTTSEKRFLSIPVATKPADSQIINLPPSPSIIWAIPTEKNTILKTSSTNIQAIIRSASDLKSVVLYVNSISQGETEVKPSPNEAGSYLIEKIISFNQIENNVYFEAVNTGGVTKSLLRYFICPSSSLLANQSSQTTTKTSETGPINKPAATITTSSKSVSLAPAAPVITWTSPSGTHTTLDSFTGTVKASIKSDDGLKSVFIYLNGISKGEAEIKPVTENAGSYLMEKTINFGPGENNIFIVATNNMGSTKSELRYFSNPSAVVPVITWSNPVTSNSVVNIESFNVSACIKSPIELRSVKLLVNGSIQTEDNIFQASANDDCNYKWQSSVVLREGDNSIFIIATNIAGSTTSEKRVIKLSQAIAEKRLALVFGNSQYKNRAPLRNPENDANLIEGTLKELGFDVIKKLNVGKVEMEAAIREFNEKLPDYNVALFYYAGHGNQVDGKNYIIPVDAILEKPGDCKYEAIDVNFVVEEFEKYQDNTNIVILDACRSNPFASWTRGGEAGFKTMNFTSGTIVAYATSEGATAADGKGSNGLYTEELVKQMVIPQSISSVFMNTRVQVRKFSNNQQVPSETNKLNGEFFFKK